MSCTLEWDARCPRVRRPPRLRVERRREARRPIDGRIRLVSPALDGLLLDLSEEGARFMVLEPRALHGVLTIAFTLAGATTYAHCCVRWCRVEPDGAIVGVAFGRA